MPAILHDPSTHTYNLSALKDISDFVKNDLDIHRLDRWQS